ncbi:MAG TPA: FAD-dependent oxidoreductase, partial [Candidatus Obscuribacterales bacterium]
MSAFTEPEEGAQQGSQTSFDPSSSTVTVVDVMKVSVDHPAAGLKSFKVSGEMTSIECDILVVGGGTGGVAAALAAARAGYRVCITEETDWLGGQMTSQGVSALDENALVETTGATRAYLDLRQAIRRHYLSQYKANPACADHPYFNPGNCWVSRLAFEPAVAVRQIELTLAPYVQQRLISVHYRMKAAAARMTGDTIRSIIMVNLADGRLVEFEPRVCIDATELGDLLPLCGARYRYGSESRAITGEPHAPEVGDSQNVQDFVYPFAVEFRPGENHTIAKPPHYDAFRAAGKFSFNSYKMFERATGAGPQGQERELLPFWEYRRLIDKSNFVDPHFACDVAMINWDSNDLRGFNIIDERPATVCERLALAKALSLGFLYWLQTEAPRDEGGSGYPELKLRPDVMGTTDGLSKHPYIRESRRLAARHIIVEQDIVEATNPEVRARHFDDSVGIGHYPVDIHGRQDVPDTAQATRPFQIPLGALISLEVANLLPAAKNIGTTHITNGAYRLHPIEWCIGESAGALAAFALTARASPSEVHASRRLLREFQLSLLAEGIPLYWYDDVPPGDAAFIAAQFLAVTGILPGSADHLHFSPDEPVPRGQAAAALARLCQMPPA